MHRQPTQTRSPQHQNKTSPNHHRETISVVLSNRKSDRVGRTPLKCTVSRYRSHVAGITEELTTKDKRGDDNDEKESRREKKHYQATFSWRGKKSLAEDLEEIWTSLYTFHELTRLTRRQAG
jgi:hypothetical protein